MDVVTRYIDRVAVNSRQLPVTRVGVVAAANGTRELIAAPGAGYRLRILSLLFTHAQSFQTVRFKTGTTDLVSGIYMQPEANVPTTMTAPTGYIFLCGTNEAFNVVTPASGAVYTLIAYVTEPV